MRRLSFEWVIGSCRLLGQIREEFERTRPFAGLRIGTGIHLEPKTVALLLTLAAGGAEVVSTGNLNTTQQEALDYLAAHAPDDMWFYGAMFWLRRKTFVGSYSRFSVTSRAYFSAPYSASPARASPWKFTYA